MKQNNQKPKKKKFSKKLEEIQKQLNEVQRQRSLQEVHEEKQQEADDIGNFVFLTLVDFLDIIIICIIWYFCFGPIAAE